MAGKRYDFYPVLKELTILGRKISTNVLNYRKIYNAIENRMFGKCRRKDSLLNINFSERTRLEMISWRR